MAIALPHAYFLFRLKLRAFPETHFTLMDIGEQNWHGSTSVAEVVEVAKQMGIPIAPASLTALQRADADEQNIFHDDPALLQKAKLVYTFHKARIFYSHLLGVNDYAAIDLNGTRAARRINLNTPFEPDRQYDVVLNFGTTEHVFNQFEAFNTIHKLCRTDGFMVHGLPLSGGREHGFFNYHATTFFDLCAANDYVMTDLMWSAMRKKEDRTIAAIESFTDRIGLLKFLDELPLGTEGLYVCLQKKRDAPFQCPQQGYYDSPSNEEERAFLNNFWKRHR